MRLLKRITRDSLRVNRILDNGRVTYVYGAIKQPISSTIETDDGSRIPAMYVEFVGVFSIEKADKLPPHRQTD